MRLLGARALGSWLRPLVGSLLANSPRPSAQAAGQRPAPVEWKGLGPARPGTRRGGAGHGPPAPPGVAVGGLGAPTRDNAGSRRPRASGACGHPARSHLPHDHDASVAETASAGTIPPSLQCWLPLPFAFREAQPSKPPTSVSRVDSSAMRKPVVLTVLAPAVSELPRSPFLCGPRCACDFGWRWRGLRGCATGSAQPR